ncbi:MAG: hypothetical protein Q4E57_09390 [Eubacteriales bacterium]|nr:hypothetical protein [Eubacteriales bacterium]
MGAGQSDLYKGTWGDNVENIPDELKGKVKLPPNDSQLKHIFRDEEGHLPDTPENRKMVQELANDKRFHRGKDQYGNEWHVRLNEDVTQDWTRSNNQLINNAGRNTVPRPWSDKTGLYKDIGTGFRRKKR